jgi:MFS family permease
MASVILASAMAFIDGTALNVALPSLQKDLNATGSDLFWILNSYLLMLAALILTGGSLGDKLGRKKVFMSGIAIFILGWWRHQPGRRAVGGVPTAHLQYADATF